MTGKNSCAAIIVLYMMNAADAEAFDSVGNDSSKINFSHNITPSLTVMATPNFSPNGEKERAGEPAPKPDTTKW